MERLNNRRVTEKENSRPISLILEDINEEGSPNLYRISKEERLRVLEWYESNPDISDLEKAPYLEEFILHGLVDDRTALNLIRQLKTEEARGMVGEYIGRVIKPGKFIHSFYECWYSIDYTVKGELRNRFINDQSNNGLMMVIPFIRTEATLRDPTRSILDTRFNNVKDSNRLIETLLSFYESSSEIPDINSQELGFSNPIQEFVYGSLKDIIRAYKNKKPYFLIPYISRLMSVGLLTLEDAKSLFNNKNISAYSPDESMPEEEEEIKSLSKEIKGYKPFDPHQYFDLATTTPRLNIIRINRIKDERLRRSAKNALHNFRENVKNLGIDSKTYLSLLIDNNIPVFSEIESLGLTREEVRILISIKLSEGNRPFCFSDFSDLKTLLDWDRRNQGDPGKPVEDFIVNHLIKTIDEWADSDAGVFIGDIISWFSDGNRERIIKSINANSPHSWLGSLSYALENGVITLDKIITQASMEQPWLLISFLDRIIYHINLIKKEGRDVEITIEQVKELVKKTILDNPAFLAKNHSLKKIVDRLFTPEEISNFIRQKLNTRPVRLDFLISLKDSGFEDEFTNEIREAILSDSEIIVGIFDESTIPFINKFFNSNEIISFLIKYRESLDLSNIVSIDLIRMLVEKPDKLDLLIESIVSEGGIADLRLLYNSFSSYIGYPAQVKANIERDIARQEEEIKKLEKNLETAPDSEKDFILQAIDNKKSALDKLKSTPPLTENPASIETAEKYKATIKKLIKKIVESKKFSVFEDGVIRILGPESREIVMRDVEEYVKTRPEILFEKSYVGRLSGYRYQLLEVLTNEEFNQLLESRLRSLALSIDSSASGYLPTSLMDKFIKANPMLIALERGSLDKDFYETVIDRIKDYRFFPLYRDELTRISKNELAMYGPRLNISDYTPNSDFTKLVNTIAVLEHLEIDNTTFDTILKLDHKDRDELINLLKLTSTYYLDEGVDFSRINNDYDSIKRELFLKVIDLIKRIFEIDESDFDISKASLSINSINALSIYFDKSCKEKKEQKRSAIELITQALNGNYESWRTWGNETPEDLDLNERFADLKERKVIPQGMTLEQYQTWNSDFKFKFTEIFSYELSDVRSGINDILSLAVVDGHIESGVIDLSDYDLSQKYSELLEPIRRLSKIQLEFRNKIKEAKAKGQDLSPEEKRENEDIKNQIREYREDNEAEIKNIEALRIINRIRDISTEEIELKSFIIDSKKIPFKDAFILLEEVFRDSPDFLSDIRRIRSLLMDANQQIFNGQRVARSELSVTDRVDFETYLYIGEKPVPSCQHYNGSDNNQGLISYLADSSVRIAQIWDNKGQIIARAVMRLMEDENGSPQLFMERVYSINNHPKIKNAILSFAKDKAKSMNIGFYTKEIDYMDTDRDLSIPNKITLFNRGSRVPYVYTDAGGGKFKNGRFQVEVFG